MPLSHISLATGAAKWAAMRLFYLKSLESLGYVIFFEKENHMLGLKPMDGTPDFWLHVGNGEQAPSLLGGDVATRPGRTHVAFNAEGPDQVDKWYAAAMKSGGICNGPPGLRPQYSESYYAAFVLDPLGNNIEVLHYKHSK